MSGIAPGAGPGPHGPGAAGEAEIDALAGLPLAADHLSDARQLLRHTFVRRGDFVGTLAAEIGRAVADHIIAHLGRHLFELRNVWILLL